MSHRTPTGQRAPSTKWGRNKHKCDKYAMQDRRTKNKAARAKRILKGFHWSSQCSTS